MSHLVSTYSKHLFIILITVSSVDQLDFLLILILLLQHATGLKKLANNAH